MLEYAFPEKRSKKKNKRKEKKKYPYKKGGSQRSLIFKKS
jgi:hypothetical protein